LVLSAARNDETAHLEALEAVLIAPQEQGVTKTAGRISKVIREEGEAAVETEAEEVMVIGLQVVRMTITTTVGVVADLVIDLLVQGLLRRIRKISWLRVCVTKSL